MNLIRRAYSVANRLTRGQTMAEYALILGAVAIVVYVSYQLMGTTLTTMLSTVDTLL